MQVYLAHLEMFYFSSLSTILSLSKWLMKPEACPANGLMNNTLWLVCWHFLFEQLWWSFCHWLKPTAQQEPWNWPSLTEALPLLQTKNLAGEQTSLIQSSPVKSVSRIAHPKLETGCSAAHRVNLATGIPVLSHNRLPLLYVMPSQDWETDGTDMMSFLMKAFSSAVWISVKADAWVLQVRDACDLLSLFSNSL